jgi:hypothetical protein
LSDDALARRYRAVMRVYPPQFRTHSGEELIGTLLEAATSSQRWPRFREVASILLEGVRARLGVGAPLAPWAVAVQALWVGGFLLLARAGGETILRAVEHEFSTRAGVTMIMLAMLAVTAMLDARYGMAICLTIVWQAVQMRISFTSWHLATAICVLALLAAQRSGRQDDRPRHSATWLAAVPVILALTRGPDLLTQHPVYMLTYLNAGMIILTAIGLASTFVDARAPIIAACLLVPEVLHLTLFVPPIRSGLHLEASATWWALAITISLATLCLTGYLAARRRARF